jgi:thioredoxin-like negative regulator of GroEL
MPTNLLEAGIGALADYPDPSALRGLTDFIHTQAPELLDALTAREDWLLADPNVRQRWMAQLQAGDSVTKWKGYQQVIEVATQCGDSQLQVQAVEACLSLPDPSLAPQQAEMLQQRIYSCDDMGLREHLIERLVAIRPDQAQPHLWQLLQVYRGQQRQRDAARIVKLLKDIGEDGPTLRDCAKANGNHRSH